MADIRAFHAMRYTKSAGEAKELTCPPYDIISEAERAAFLERNPHNVIRLELPRGEEPYKTAGKTLHTWLSDGTLRCDKDAGLYIYEEEFKTDAACSKKLQSGKNIRVWEPHWWSSLYTEMKHLQ